MYKEKIEIYQEKIKTLTEQINTYYFSKDYLMKMFSLDKNKIRKHKINKLFNDKTREI